MLFTKKHGGTLSKYTLKAPNMPPGPDGFVYKQYESGARFHSYSHTECAALVLQHRIANDYPKATIEECISDVIDQTCILYGPDYCVNSEFERVAFSDGWDRIVAGTNTLAALAKASGDNAYVSQQVAEKRAEGCKNCFARTTTSGCLSCGFMNLVRKLIGETINRGVSNLEESSSCRACGCLLAAKTALSPEILLAGMTENQRAAYKEVGSHCFMTKLQEEIDLR